MQIIGVNNTVLSQQPVHIGQMFLRQFAAQLNIHAAPGHISRNCYRAKRARRGNDFRFLGVFTRVEHLMLHTSFDGCIQTRPILGREV